MDLGQVEDTPMEHGDTYSRVEGEEEFPRIVTAPGTPCSLLSRFANRLVTDLLISFGKPHRWPRWKNNASTKGEQAS
jgi:hypothetical protein